MNNRILLLCIILTLFSATYKALGQTSLSLKSLCFHIVDLTTSHSLSNVMCRVYTKDNKFYSYAISDKNGCLCIKVSDNDIIEFSYLGYTPLKQSANDFDFNEINNVILAEKTIELNEVIVKDSPIQEQNDTISYNVRAFIQAGDSHLEDILKKLPGIRVNENGSLSYLGKAINKFYIEGKDLLGNSYSLATKNMPIEAVTTVEVLENHQPLKILKGKQFSDKAAINIRIDRGHKSHPFGEVKGGFGNIASIWDNRLFLTQIMSNSQLLISGKTNNSGVDLSEDTKEHIDVADLDAYESILPSVLSTSTLNEVLPQNRYLHNKSYSTGANFLLGLSAESSLRFNLLYYQDQSNITRQRSNYYGGVNTLNIIETSSIGLKNFSILPIIKYELNSNKSYISNEIKISFNNSATSNSVNTNGINLFERIDNKPTYLQNYFTTSFYINN